MSARLNPYLAFRGNAREAMEFYATVFGGTLTTMAFADMGGMGVPEEEQQWLMHSDLMVSDGVTLMGSDYPTSMPGEPVNGSVSLSGTDFDLLTGWWEKLGEGAEVTMPLAQAPWGDHFGQLTDRFGIAWMINVAGPDSASA